MAGKSVASHDVGLPLRFKLGIHTIFLFVDPVAPFSNVTDELLRVLRERYPDGELSLSLSRSGLVRIPTEEEETHISYAILKNPKDTASGWRDLKISGTETPASKSLKDNMIVAFALRSDGEEDEEKERFDVEFPTLDDPEMGE